MMRHIIKYLLIFVFVLTAKSQQAVNNFSVKSNLNVGQTLNNYDITSVLARSVQTIADLTNTVSPLSVSTNAIVNVQSYVANADGGGGMFSRISSTGITADYVTYYPSTSSSWVWKRIRNSTYYDIREGGAVGDGITDNAVAIQRVINSTTVAAGTFGGGLKPEIVIPNGKFLVKSTLLITNPVVFRGVGIEINSVSVAPYSLNGSTIVSGITNGSSVIKLVGKNAGGSDTILQGIELRDFGIDGTGLDGAGIEISANYNTSDILFSRLIIRRVGGSGIKSGDGTLNNSPRWGYSTFENITVIYPGLDGFEFYNSALSAVKMRFTELYVNGAGRHGHHFVDIGDFYAENWSENNAGQLMNGDGLHLVNVNNATFMNCIWEGDGRTQTMGSSWTPTNSAAAARLAGVSKCTFINSIFTSPSGNLITPNNSGVIELVSSVATNGYSARDAAGNFFLNCNITGYVPNVTAPTGTASGSGGALSSGVLRYRVTHGYTNGWYSPISASLEFVITVANNNSVNLTAIPTGDSSMIIARKIYRTTANGNVFKLLHTIANNTETTYFDNTPDASLGQDINDFFIIYADSSSHFNRFTHLNLAGQPYIRDLGLNNTFDKIFSAAISPSVMPNIGHGSFNNILSTANNGTRHFFGADNTGMLTGYGITPSTPHQASFIIPSYGASRFANGQNTMIDTIVGDGTAVTSIGGGNSQDYANTEVAIYAAAGSTTTTGTKQVSIKSSGTVFNTAVSNLSTVYVTGDAGFGGHITLTNNKYIRFLDANNVVKSVITKSDNGILYVGSASDSERVTLNPGSGGIHLGQPTDLVYNVIIPRANYATSANPMRNSKSLMFVSSYYDGTNEVQMDSSTWMNQETAGPLTSRIWRFSKGGSGTNVMQLKNTGELIIPVGPIQLGDSIAQHSVMTAKALLTDNSATELFLYKAGDNQSRLVLANNSSLDVDLHFVARNNTVDRGSYWRRVMISRGANAASTAIDGQATNGTDIVIGNASTWTIALSADTTNGSLKIMFTGASGVQVVCGIQVVQNVK